MQTIASDYSVISNFSLCYTSPIYPRQLRVAFCIFTFLATRLKWTSRFFLIQYVAISALPSLVRRQSATFIIFFNYEPAYAEGSQEGQGSSGSLLRGQLCFGPLAKHPRTRTCLSSVSSFFFFLMPLMHVYGGGSGSGGGGGQGKWNFVG